MSLGLTAPLAGVMYARAAVAGESHRVSQVREVEPTPVTGGVRSMTVRPKIENDK